jgi:hypothetical protein
MHFPATSSGQLRRNALCNWKEFLSKSERAECALCNVLCDCSRFRVQFGLKAFSLQGIRWGGVWVKSGKFGRRGALGPGRGRFLERTGENFALSTTTLSMSVCWNFTSLVLHWDARRFLLLRKWQLKKEHKFTGCAMLRFSFPHCQVSVLPTRVLRLHSLGWKKGATRGAA